MKRKGSKSVTKTKAATEPKKKGRPSLYSEDIAETICAALMAGYSLVKICSLEDMPTQATVYNWLAKDGHPFLERYTRAREIQAEHLVDQIIDISDDDSKDVSGELGIPNGVAVQRAKLRTENRKWVAMKLLPKKYGEKVDLNHTGKVTLESLILGADATD